MYFHGGTKTFKADIIHHVFLMSHMLISHVSTFFCDVLRCKVESGSCFLEHRLLSHPVTEVRVRDFFLIFMIFESTGRGGICSVGEFGLRVLRTHHAVVIPQHGSSSPMGGRKSKLGHQGLAHNSSRN